MLIVNVDSAAQLPAFAEPWFLTFNATAEVHPVMSPQELKDSGLEKLGEKWK